LNKKKPDIIKDEIFNKKKQQSITAQSFLAALKANLDHEQAFKIATEAFTQYMTKTYEKVLTGTKEYTQERFDRFRKFYEDYASNSPYIDVVESTETILKVKYSRCPFYEILIDEDLDDLAYAFCLSDAGFTENVLPGVIFSRENEIVKGSKYCDHTWKFKGE